ncbi:MAG: hypothetical protein ACEQSB_00015 [Undibacterium sp.]
MAAMRRIMEKPDQMASPSITGDRRMMREQIIEVMARVIFAKEGQVHTTDERMFEPVKWEELDDDDYQVFREGYRNQASAALAAIEALGYVVVPREATEAMEKAEWGVEELVTPDEFIWAEDEDERGRMIPRSSDSAIIAEPRAKIARQKLALNQIAELTERWTHIDEIRMRCGELTAREMRTAKAITDSINSRIGAIIERSIHD